MFTEKKAEWKEKKEEFKLKGKTPDNGTILVLNAVDRSLIAEIEPSHDHFSLRTTIQGGLGVPLGVSAFTGPIGDAVDTLSFYADGSGTTKIAGIPFTWSEFGGVLTLNYSSPANDVSGGVKLRINGERFFWDTRTQDGPWTLVQNEISSSMKSVCSLF